MGSSPFAGPATLGWMKYLDLDHEENKGFFDNIHIRCGCFGRDWEGIPILC